MGGARDDDDAQTAAAAARARAAMAAGATLDDVLHTFRTHEHFGSIHSIMALRKIAPMNLSCASVIVSTSCKGLSYAHLTLADLELLGAASPVGVDGSTRSRRDDAIIERKPYLLYVRNRETNEYVYSYTSTTPLEAPPAHGRGLSGGMFERLCADVRRSAAAWPTELRILRDEPDQLLLHFLRAAPAS